MRRFRCLTLAAILASGAAGCGEDQPNAPADTKELNADFGKNAQDMMKKANSGMDLKASQKK